jgi:N-acetylmuramoyl-L-alanine amidase
MSVRYDRRNRRRREELRKRIIIFSIILLIVIISGFAIWRIFSNKDEIREQKVTKVVKEAPEFTVELLTPNEYSRPGTAMEKINGIVIHYTANPGTTAKNNRDYFEGLKDSQLTKASSHFVVGIEGEVIQCIPSSEISYASNQRNGDTISIEVCHPDESGEFTKETYDSLVYLVAWLCGKFDLQVDDVIRHYDVTGKICPKYYVEHEDAWVKLKQDVLNYIEKNGVDPSQAVEEQSEVQ